ncbi:hypothetical protein GCM10027055_08730 [Janibacter alkaliphilus]|uniref:Uncharacterized protein n=1 Tax=Janibacter alkaliphilus TaxID=1069963 RepID=A0A852WZM1_9MICO|nr:hypothetical protein [Janibacter alkaliphilus]NYG36059.1 hypothetical protein [Janibacter alkaliphilus]
MTSGEADQARSERWCLIAQEFRKEWTSQPGPHEYCLHVLRDLSVDQVKDLRAAAVASATLRSDSQVIPFEHATSDALAAIEAALRGPVEWAFDPEAAIAPNLTLDQWLSRAVVTRSRLVRDVRRALGREPSIWLNDAFDHQYKNDAEYRLVHQWRNASQHRVAPLEMTRTRERLGQATLWTMSMGAVERDESENSRKRRSKNQDSLWPDFVLDLVAQEPDLREVIRSVTVKTLDAYAGCLVTHEQQIVAHLELLARYYREGQVEHPGPRLVGTVPNLSEASVGDDIALGAWIPLRLSSVEALALDIDNARQRINRVGRPSQA